jgi:hypothetical protein
MTLPQPRHFAIGEMVDQRQRLGIVHDDRVAIVKVKACAIFEYNLLVDCLFNVRKIDVLALQRVVKLFGAAKEAWRSLNQMPVGFDPCCVHHQS